MHTITSINMPGIVFQALYHGSPFTSVLLRSVSNHFPSNKADRRIAAHFIINIKPT